jgi:hypothetical protein
MPPGTRKGLYLDVLESVQWQRRNRGYSAVDEIDILTAEKRRNLVHITAEKLSR